MGLYEDIIIQRQKDEERNRLLEEQRLKLEANKQPAALEFLGQAIWGATSALSMGTLDIADAYAESKDPDAETWEDWFSLGGPSEWEDLSNWGKAGYTVGAAIGMLPTFMVGGAGGRALTKGIGSLGNVGTRSLKKQATKELLEKSANVASKHGDEVLEVITKKAPNIMDDVYDLAGKGSIASQAGKELGEQFYREVAIGDIAGNLAKILPASEKKIAGELAQEAFEIFTRNNPADAAGMMRAMVRQIPGLDNRAGKIIGAMAFESMIGLNMGLLRSGINNTYRAISGFEGPDQYGFKPEGNYFVDAMHHGLNEAAWFSVIGPVKFIKGGTKKALWKKAQETFTGMYKGMRNPSRLAHKELQHTLTAMDIVQGGTLNSSVGSKWAKKGAKWWKDSVEGEGTKEMRTFLTEARKKFLLRAPVELTKEFGREVFYSAPRMGMGVLAMNAHGLYDYYSNGGNGLPFNALGRDPAEIIGNVMTAAWFTRRPHSFHDNKPMKFFETGKIDDYFDGKASELRKTSGMLNTMIKTHDGTRLDRLEKIVGRFSVSNPTGVERAKEVVSHSITSSKEMTELREIVKPHILKEGQQVDIKPGLKFTDIRDAINSYIANNMSEKGKEVQRDELLKKTFIAKKILELHDQYTIDNKLGSNMQTVTADQAVRIVEKIANIRFGESQLTYQGILRDIPSWIMENVSRNTIEPMDISKRFIKNIYDALDVNYTERPDGKIIAPDIRDIVKFSDPLLLEAFSTVIKNGNKTGWLTFDQSKEGLKTDKLVADQQIKAQKVWDQSIDELMGYTYGSEWRTKGVERDMSILQNDAWYSTYRNIQDIRDARNARSLLKGEPKSDVDVTEFNRLYAQLNKFLFARENPGIVEEVIDAASKTTPQERVELSQFIKRLHLGVRNLNPRLNKKNNNPLTIEEAKALKEKVEQLVGDVFSREESFRFFERQSFETSIEQLGLRDLSVGFDLKSAILDLYTNEGFSYGESGQILFPHLKTIKNSLEAAQRNKDITKESAKELLDFYSDLVKSVDEAGVGQIRFSEAVTEDVGGQWHSALKMAKIKALNSISGLISQEATLTSDYAFIARDNMKMKRQLIEQGALERSDAKQAKNIEEIIKLYDNSIHQLDRLGASLKEAIDTNNSIELHAWSKDMSKLREIIKNIEMQPETTKDAYLNELVQLKNQALQKMHKNQWTETTINDLVAQKLRNVSGDIPGKDVKDVALRTTLAQFSLRYGIGAQELQGIFDPAVQARLQAGDIQKLAKEFLTDWYDNQGGIQNIEVRTFVENTVASINKLSGSVDMDGKSFHEYIYKPLKARIMVDRENARLAGEKLKHSFETVESDLYTVASSFFSTRPVKHLQIDFSNGTLYESTKPLGYTPDRGITGLINHLEGMGEAQSKIYILSNDVVMDNGARKSLLSKAERQDVDARLRNSDFPIESIQGEADFYARGQRDKILSVDNTEPILSRDYKIINLDEKTNILVRMDTGIKKNIAAAYDVGSKAGESGSLYRKLEAILATDGQTINDNPRVKRFIDRLQSADKMDNATASDAILMTRLLLDMPSFAERAIDQHGRMNVNSAEFKDRWKRLGMTHSKNGYIGTPDNLNKTNTLYKNMESPFHKSVYKRIKKWISPDLKGKFRKLKVLSINDESVHANKNLVNIFSSIDRAKVEIEGRRNNGEITKETADYMTKRYEELTKSIVDGEMFVSKDVLLASMAMRGITREMVDYDPVNNKILGFKSGAIKPTITHVDVNSDINSSKYGEVSEWYGKTAFKYAPEIDAILGKYKVDAITFKSANKINEHKANAQSKWDVDAEGKSIRYAEPLPVEVGSSELGGTWVDFAKKTANLNVNSESITELPFSSINLRSISRQHDGMVGNNTAVHMRDNNGLADWIGTERKIDALSYGFQNQFRDIFFRTELAKKVFGAAAESGDNTGARSGIEAVLSRNGLLTDPWMQKRLEENLINYYINNGNVGAGLVKDSSIDVMTADFGNLATPIRSHINVGGKDIRTVQFFGESQMSHYNGTKKFQLYGEGDNANIQSAIIQKVKYTPQEYSYDYNGTRSKDAAKERTADGYLVTSSTGKQYLIVEGMAIDKQGRMLNLDNIDRNKLLHDDSIFLQGNLISRANMMKLNKQAFDTAVKNQQAFLAEAQSKGAITMSDYVANAFRFKENNNVDINIGSLDSRQPRNMAGDIVITKLKAYRDKDGKIITSVDERSGNLSRMNHVDAISPQDADFDMDKSFKYTASHGNFWLEAGRLAGYDLTRGNEITIGQDFANLFSTEVPRMMNASNYSHESLVAQGNMHRGLFVKMHQTASYLHNIFRDTKNVLHFKGDFIGRGQNQKFSVRMKDNSAYISTVDNIAEWTKRYIDLYKNAINQENISKAKNTQYDILFGETGLFEIVDTKTNRPIDYNLNAPDLAPVREAIINRLINPVNKYLTMNKGFTVDEFGGQRKAGLSEYDSAYRRILQAVSSNKDIDSYFSWAGIKNVEGDINNPTIDIRPGLQSAQRYFANSSAPFDLAMKNLHQIYDQMYSIKSITRDRTGRDRVNDFLDYIEEGFAGDMIKWEKSDPAAREVQLAEIKSKALSEFVADQSRSLILFELAGKLKTLNFQIEEMERFGKTEQLLERDSYKALIEKRTRLIDAKSEIESALTTQYGDPLEVELKVLRHKGYKKKVYNNKGNLPVVIVDGNSKKVREVVLPGKRNFNDIKPKDILVENGRRFEITDPLHQAGLKVLYERFGGLPGYTDTNNGRRYVLSNEENSAIVLPAVGRIMRNTIEARERLSNRNALSNARMARERLAAIVDELANNTDINNAASIEQANLYRWGIISRLLSPREDRSAISMRKVGGGMGRRAVLDIKLIESKFAEPVYQLLTSIENGSYLSRGMDKATAREFLDNITVQKKIGSLATQNKFINLDLLESRFFTEPADITKGYLSSDMHLSKDVFQKLQSEKQNIRTAAEIMVDYARGNRLLDGVTLYKASRELTKAGVPIDRQMVRTKTEILEDGTGRIYGERIKSISELDSSPSRKWGQGTSINESVSKRINEVYKCYE